MLGVLTAVNAQTYVCDLDGFEITDFIPGTVTTSGHPLIIHQTESSDNLYNYSIYQSDFTTQVTTINNINCERIEFGDLDNLSTIYFIKITQTLFNNDAYFEYFDYERDENDHVIAINLKSTNGSILWSYRRPDGMIGCGVGLIFKLDNKYYMRIYTYNEDFVYHEHLFLINHNQGITEINNALSISAFPTMPTRDQQITVELGEGTNAHEITVVNGLGQELKRIPLEEGQRTVTIPARELGRGLNVLNARSDCNQGNCKIIVR